jgi:monofunctional biosynthetic peptidoglycan transglycosylase
MARRKRKSSLAKSWKRWAPRLAAGAVLLLVLYFLFELVTWPDVAALKSKRPETTAFIERYQDRTNKNRVARTWVPYDHIALSFKHAVLAGEDIGFLHHDGFASEEIEDALKDALFEGKKLRGASTITQQLAKNLWLSASRNPLRKLKEAILTRQLEHSLSKKRILEIYMNVVELGPGVFGVEAAAQHWFGSTAATLTEEQAIALAAMLPAPTRRNAREMSEAHQRHADAIRRRMSRSMHLREKL